MTPPVTDVQVMLNRIKCEIGVWSAKRSQGKTELHLCQWWANFLDQGPHTKLQKKNGPKTNF